MKPLKIAVVYKNRNINERENRAVGWWSYPTPEFEFDFFPAVPMMGTGDFQDYDLILHEDTCKTHTWVRSPHGPPLAYLDIDSTLSPNHHQARLNLARQADLVLVDHELLDRFKPTKKPVRRLNYCVNDRVFRPSEVRSIDVCFHCGSGESRGLPGGRERNEIRAQLGEYCAARGLAYVSGGVGLEEYAAHMGAARVVVNWPRTPTNRPHRVFDAMASGAALLTGPLPPVDGDHREAGMHYREFGTQAEMLAALDELLVGGWKGYGLAGYALVAGYHTWAIRAQELRQILAEELGL